jgi:preprotein translocase SecE subunit
MANFSNYLASVREEMNKVNWPSWPMLKSSTLVVVFVSLVLAFTVKFFDLVLTRLLGWIL